MVGPRQPFVILHLSDLHFGPHCRFKDLDEAKLATLAKRLASAVNDARAKQDMAPPVALILATGDIAEYAHKDQYADAERFFTSLAEAFQLSPARVLFVPGNHDISWPHCRRVENNQEIDGFDDEERARRIRREKLAPYRDFQTLFYGCQPGNLGGSKQIAPEVAHAFVHTFDDLGVSVAALDSCERETHADHGGQLGEVQAQALMDHWRADERPYLRIAAVHHNPTADAPDNIAAWADGLKQHRPDGDRDRARMIDHFIADTHGFGGWQRLKRVAKDCRVSLVLHGHVHTPGLASWSHGGDFDHTQISAAGSWGLMDSKRPQDEPMTIQLLHVGKSRAQAGPRVEQVRLRYEPRARQAGHVEPGDFVIDSGEGATMDLPLSLPPGHPGFIGGEGVASAGVVVGSASAMARDAEMSERELDDFLAAYRRHNRAARDEWDLGGLGTASEEAGDFRPTLRDMYIPLRFTRAGKDGDGAPITPADVADADQPMVLRGTAGRGKTTWMRWTFCQLLDDPTVVPFLIELRVLTRAWAERPESEHDIERYLVEHNARFAHGRDEGRAGRAITALLERAHGVRPVLLIDGWDEAGEIGDRLRQDLKGLLGRYARVGAVVTSRPHELSKPSSHSDDFVVWDLELLDRQDIAKLAGKYFSAKCRNDPDEAEHDRANFLSALDHSSSASELARTPLLLTMMLIISASRTLSDKRHELYEACIDTLLFARPEVREQRGTRTGRCYWVPEGKRERVKVVARLARWLSENGGFGSDERQVVATRDEVIKCCSNVGVEAEQSAAFVAWLVDIAGLLVERDGGQNLGFVHFSFQEYLCAWDMHRDLAYDSTEQRLGAFQARLYDLSWWETLRLWASMIHGDNEAGLTPILSRLRSERAFQEVKDLSTRNQYKAAGFWLAGAILADGHGREVDVLHWAGHLSNAFTGLGYHHMQAAGSAWRGSGQTARRRDINSELAELVATQSWVGWELAAEWVEQAGLEAPEVAPTGLARHVIGLINREGRVAMGAAREVALSRVLFGSTPWWPVAPIELGLLRLWPGRRPLSGVRLQSLIVHCGSRDVVVEAIAGLESGLAANLGDFTRRLAWYLAQDFARYFTLNFAQDLAQDFARYFALNLARCFTRDFTRYFALDVAVDFARYFAQDFARDLELDFAQDFPQDFAQDLSRGVARDLSRDFALEFARDFVRDFASDLALDLASPSVCLYAYSELRAVVGRASVRAAVANSHESHDPLIALFRSACRSSFTGRYEPELLAEPLRALPSGTHPIWPALARWISRGATEDDRRILEHYAANPDECDAPLSWGMKYIVRGDLVLEDGSEVTLDQLYEEAGVARLPLIEPMPAEIDLGDRNQP